MKVLRTLTFVLALGALTAASPVWAGRDVPVQIPNLSDVKTQIIKYHDSGQWDRDGYKVAHRAEAWIDASASKYKKPAIVFDIDETALLNWKEELDSDFGYIPSMWIAWEKTKAAPAFAPTQEIYWHALKKHVTVFFITGRKEGERSYTEANLRNAGYLKYKAVIFKPANYHQKSIIPFKSGQRAAIEKQGYTVLATVGDQWSDLRGGSALRMFKMPNPMYYIP